MQFLDMIKPIEEMSDEELRLQLINLKKRREVEHTKAKRVAKNSSTKSSAKGVSTIQSLLKTMTPEQIKQFVLTMQERSGQ